MTKKEFNLMMEATLQEWKQRLEASEFSCNYEDDEISMDFQATTQAEVGWVQDAECYPDGEELYFSMTIPVDYMLRPRIPPELFHELVRNYRFRIFELLEEHVIRVFTKNKGKEPVSFDYKYMGHMENHVDFEVKVTNKFRS